MHGPPNLNQIYSYNYEFHQLAKFSAAVYH